LVQTFPDTSQTSLAPRIRLTDPRISTTPCSPITRSLTRTVLCGLAFFAHTARVSILVYAGLDALTASYTKWIRFQVVFVALFFLLVFNTSAIVVSIVGLITCVREDRFGLSVVVIFRAIIVDLTGDVSILIEANNACIQGFAVFLACWLGSSWRSCCWRSCSPRTFRSCGTVPCHPCPPQGHTRLYHRLTCALCTWPKAA